MASLYERKGKYRRQSGRNLMAKVRMSDGSIRSRGFKDAAARSQWVKKIEAEDRVSRNRLKRTSIHPQQATVGDALVLYEATAPEGVTSQTWRANYEPIVRRWKAHAFAERPLGRLYRDEIRAWIRAERHDGTPFTTISSRLNVLRRAFDHAADRWRINIPNPASDHRLGQDEKRRRRPTPDEKAALYAVARACRDPRLYWAMRWSGECGMRRAEIAQSRLAYITHESQGRRITTGPAKAGERSFFMWDELIDLHEQIRQDIGHPRLLLGGIRADSITQAFERVRARAGVSRDVTFHSFRYEAVSWMVEAGVPKALRLQIIGHADDAMSNHYTNFSSQSVSMMNQAVTRRPD